MINIQTKPDMSVDPGHQWIVLPRSFNGYAPARLLVDRAPIIPTDDGYMIPHTYVVDTAIKELIDALAHVRFSAPELVQITLPEAAESIAVDEDGGLEGA